MAITCCRSRSFYAVCRGDGLFAGPDVKEEEAERARSLQMVLQQAEEERARRVAHDAKGENAV